MTSESRRVAAYARAEVDGAALGSRTAGQRPRTPRTSARRVGGYVRSCGRRAALAAAVGLAALVVCVAPASAAASSGCPAGGIDTSAMTGAEKQVGELRNDLATSCTVAQENANNLHDDVSLVVGAVLGASLVPSILRVLSGMGERR